MAHIVHVTSPAPRRTLAAAIWLAGLLTLLLWSLASWMLALVFTGGGDFLATQAAAWSAYHPEIELAVATANAWLARFGSTALWLVWVLGALMIVFCTWLTVEGARALRGGFERLQPGLSSAWSDLAAKLKARGAPTAPNGPN